ISKRSGVMESLACCNEMKAGNAQRNNQLKKYCFFIFERIIKKSQLKWQAPEVLVMPIPDSISN
ncbi:MAG: hypothetical protein JXR70_01560, partial [Spirochaetales bacterium]|nr:hypothetical protein [Spirochaetales bacterium]